MMGRSRQAKALGKPLVWCLLAIHLIFALAPHHHQARHSHAEDGHGHTHAVATLHQAKLERQFLAALAPATHQAKVELTEKLASTPSPSVADEKRLADAELMGSPGLKPQSQTSHDHFFSDPNVDSTPSSWSLAQSPCGKLGQLPQAMAHKAEATVAQAWPRGPPRV